MVNHVSNWVEIEGQELERLESTQNFPAVSSSSSARTAWVRHAALHTTVAAVFMCLQWPDTLLRSDSQHYLYTMSFQKQQFDRWTLFAFSFKFCSGELILHYCDNDNEEMECNDCTRAVHGFISRLRLLICAGEQEDKVCTVQLMVQLCVAVHTQK